MGSGFSIIIALVVGGIVGGLTALLISQRRASRTTTELTAQVRALEMQAADRVQLASNDEIRARMALEVVEPMRVQLQRVQEALNKNQETSATTFGELRQQLKTLDDQARSVANETARLTGALSNSQARGSLGELQLRRLVESAGLLNHVHFHTQNEISGADSQLRPDMIVHLPSGKDIIVDSKTPMESYLRANNAGTEDERSMHMGDHVTAVRRRIDELSNKRYWASVSASSPEFVVMYLPSDALWAAAVDRDPILIEYANTRDVIIATPMTMLFMLRVAEKAWREQQLAENAEIIREAGAEMLGRLGVLAEHLTKMRRGLNSALESWNDFIGSLESRVIPSVRRMNELGVSGSVDLPSGIDSAVRRPQAPELTDDRG
jgi:DNA recombination protein RmuC